MGEDFLAGILKDNPRMAKDFITFLDYSEKEIYSLLDLADQLRAKYGAREMPRYLANKSVALIWDAEGFRNRVAFELGISAMGGTAVQIPGHLDERESIEDVTNYLNNWFDVIVARTRSHSYMQRLGNAARIPVINARTDYNHPCEILGDLAYIRAHRGSLEGLKVAFVGEATNLCHPWFEAAARLPIRVVQVCPEEYSIDKSLLAELQRGAIGELSVTSDLKLGLQDANVIYTDCWPRRTNQAESQKIERLFIPYQITPEALAMAASDVLFLPCPPVHRGEEVSAEAMESPCCHVYEAKDYLLHAQNAILATLLG
jgi:ornithine carbamoyltransferase